MNRVIIDVDVEEIRAQTNNCLYARSSINQSMAVTDAGTSASISVSYFLHFTRIQINLITTSILRSVSSSGKISMFLTYNF